MNNFGQVFQFSSLVLSFTRIFVSIYLFNKINIKADKFKRLVKIKQNGYDGSQATASSICTGPVQCTQIIKYKILILS